MGGMGARVRYWRLRRNLDRKRFADMVGRSTSWLDKIESGERALTRLPVIERVAEALAITPAVLTNAAAAEHARGCVDAAEVQAIRVALGHYPRVSESDGRPVPPARLTGQAAHLDHAWLSSRFTVVARHLPRLMADAQRAVSESVDEDRLIAHRVLVSTYRLASSVLLKFETNDLAWLAADRAMHTALSIDDTWSSARATRSAARAMTSTGQSDQAVRVLLDMADRMRTEVAANEHDLLALYGMLFLAASITAASREDAHLAGEMHEQGMLAAGRLRPHHDTHHTHFGVTNVLIHRVSALVRLHEGGRAVEFAAAIDPAAVAALSPERRSNLLLDLTEANAMIGDYRHATTLLHRAHQVAPEEVRCRPLAHGLIRLLLNNTTGDPARLVREMAKSAGVAA